MHMQDIFQILIKLDLRHTMFLFVEMLRYHGDRLSKYWSPLPQIIQKY